MVSSFSAPTRARCVCLLFANFAQPLIWSTNILSCEFCSTLTHYSCVPARGRTEGHLIVNFKILAFYKLLDWCLRRLNCYDNVTSRAQYCAPRWPCSSDVTKPLAHFPCFIKVKATAWTLDRPCLQILMINSLLQQKSSLSKKIN